MTIVASVLAPDLEGLARLARAAPRAAGRIELRLDALRGATRAELGPLIASLDRPVIAAVHGAEGFGSFEGSSAERCALLREAAHAGAAFVDVDARFAGELGALPAGVRRIVSHHEKDGTPADLAALFRSVDERASPGDLVKVVTHARCAEDGLRLLQALEASARPRIAFCSGERGSFTRLLARSCGSESVYASLDGAATAPGQLDASALAQQTAHARNAASTRFYAVVGSPVAHSWSPRLHTAAFAALGQDKLYVACEPDDFAAFFARASAWRFDGFSVTAPFKEAAARAGTANSESVRETAAANTLVRGAATWDAHNTDLLALVATVIEGQRVLPSLGHAAELAVLILGAGGAARTAAYALTQVGAAVTVAARQPARVTWGAAWPGLRVIPWEDIARVEWNVLLNCTPIGSRADPGRSPVDAALLRAGTLVVDSAYRPPETPLLRAARERGAAVVSGRAWFAAQAVAQAQLFTGVEPGRFAGVLARELERALAEDAA